MITHLYEVRACMDEMFWRVEGACRSRIKAERLARSLRRVLREHNQAVNGKVQIKRVPVRAAAQP